MKIFFRFLYNYYFFEKVFIYLFIKNHFITI